MYFYECMCVYVYVVTQDLGPLGSITGSFGPQPQLMFHTATGESAVLTVGHREAVWSHDGRVRRVIWTQP